jgi:type IV pilus assembly protein PilB
MRAVGCEACNYSGYKNRFPLIEVYEPSQQDIELLRQERFLLSPFSNQDRSMNVIATEAVVSGVTSIDEITRVLGADYWREFNALVMQDALMHVRKGLKDRREVCVLLIGATDAVTEQVKEYLQYPVVAVASAKEAVIELHNNSGIFAQFICLNKSSPLNTQIAELRRNLAWAGLPTAFIVEERDPDIEALFTQNNVSHWAALPIDINQIRKLAADLMEV